MATKKGRLNVEKVGLKFRDDTLVKGKHMGQLVSFLNPSLGEFKGS